MPVFAARAARYGATMPFFQLACRCGSLRAVDVATRQDA